MNFKDKDYVAKRESVRGYVGPFSHKVSLYQDEAVLRALNLIKAAKIMAEAGFTDEQIEDRVRRTAVDGFTAAEIIRTDNDRILGLEDLDPATLVPQMWGANGDYEKVWIQYQGTPEQRVIKDKDMVFLGMPHLFDQIVEIIQ